jgi:cyclase
MDRTAELNQSHDMEPVQGSIDLDVPASVLWDSFAQPWAWPRWNPCFFWCANRRLQRGDKLIWCFEPIRPWYGYKMPAIATIAELQPGSKVTWEVTALPGFYARHTYSVESLGENRSRFTSWEKAYGWGFRLTRRFWLRHFNFVKNRSLRGARQLEIRYLTTGKIDVAALPRRDYFGFLLAAIFIFGSIGLWLSVGRWALPAAAALLAVRVVYGFWNLYVRLKWQQLAPGVHVALDGGGNTLVVQDGADVLLVDTKFPPAAQALLRGLKARALFPITKTVNTHYHFDHSYGNVHYPAATRLAYSAVPQFMADVDGGWWKRHRDGLPNQAVSAVGQTVDVGRRKVELHYFGPGHTRGDLVVRVPEFDIVATGDLIFNSYYMFYDETAQGVDLAANIATLDMLADRWPNALFMPGHGLLARADDLRHAADYIRDLMTQARRVRAEGGGEADATRRIDLERWDLMILPWFHNDRFKWATAGSSARAVWRLVGPSPKP